MTGATTAECAFYSDGHRLAAELYSPREGSAPRGGIVFANGFMTTKERIFPEFAPALADAGFWVLGFDYRGFGASEGPPLRLVPHEQVSDVRNGLTFLSRQDGMEGLPLGVLGASFGGGVATSVTSVDDRVACMCAIMPVSNGLRWLQELRSYWEWDEFRRAVEADHAEQVLTGESRLVDRHEVMIPDPRTRAVLEEGIRKYPTMATEIRLESARAVMEFAPDRDVERIGTTPTLFIAAGDDVLVPPHHARTLHERRQGPSEFVVVDQAGHYDLYLEPHVSTVSRHVVGWFEQWL